jgi:gliding motility-associated-like protein
MKRIFSILFLSLFFFRSYGHEGSSSAPFRFIENKNQWDKKVLFKTELNAGAIFFEKNIFTYHLIDGTTSEILHNHNPSLKPDSFIIKGHVFKVKFSGANPDPLVKGDHPFPDYFNYYLGKDPSRWASKVWSYREINYQELYPGIDMKIYSSGENLKYDLIIFPGAKASDIRLQYEGLDKIFLSEGNLILKTSVNHIVEGKPYAYQIINGKKVTVPCHYVLSGNELTYSFPQGYDRREKLIIDPTLIFSTYSGSRSDNFGYTATYDSDGFLYAGSTAFGPLYPFTVGAYQTTFEGGTGFYAFGTDIAITKIDTTGTFRIYSTYLGGSRDEQPHSLIVNSKDELFLYGTTGSDDFPVSSTAYDQTFNGGTAQAISGTAVYFPSGADIIVSKFSPDGAFLLASTYIGGSGNDGLNVNTIPITLRYNYADEIRGEIEIDEEDNVYVATCTRSPDFPIVGNTFQQSFSGGIVDAVIVKLNENLSQIIWSSYLGGSLPDAAYSLELDTLQNIYVTGGTISANFPTTAGVVEPLPKGGVDGFITYIDKNGDSIIYSTYFGSANYDQIYFVDLDRFNNVYIFGQTEAPGNTFVRNAGFSQPNSGQFLAKLTPQLDSIIWSTVFGSGTGRPNISPTAFVVDLCSKIYLSGWGGTVNFVGNTNGMLTTLGPNPPTDYYQPTTDGSDFYLFVLEDDASAVHYASFFGGNQSHEHVDGGTSRFDKKGKIYQAMCAGCGGRSDMPLWPPPSGTQLPSNNLSPNCNIGVFKMDFRLPTVVADFSFAPACIGDTVQFVNKSLAKVTSTFQWSFGDGATSTDINPTHVYNAGGTYPVTLIVEDEATCNLADTLTKMIYISPLTGGVLSAYTDRDTIYKGWSTGIHAVPNTGYSYIWSPSGSLNNHTSPDPIAKPDTTTTYTVTAFDPLLPKCSLQEEVTVVVIELQCEEPRIYIPNAFTPDGDGKNDFVFVRSEIIKEFFFTIYNRWGEKVFETSDQRIGWDGTYKGMKADPGVFVYYLEATCIDDQKFFKKGNITLIR